MVSFSIEGNNPAKEQVVAEQHLSSLCHPWNSIIHGGVEKYYLPA